MKGFDVLRRAPHDFVGNGDVCIFAVGDALDASVDHFCHLTRAQHDQDQIPEQELPGMWETADFTGGADEVRLIESHRFDADGPDKRCQVIGKGLKAENACGKPESQHRYSAWKFDERTDRRLPVRAADAAQYARPSIPEDQRGQIRVRLLNATPDPLGSVAALCEQYKGNVIRSLSEVTDEQRRACLDDMGKTVLNGPLESVQFHWQIEGVTRSITHQMVRSRASFFAQESLRFAVPEGNWADEIPLPPSLARVDQIKDRNPFNVDWERMPQDHRDKVYALDTWRDAMINAQNAYERLIELGMPAEEARGVLPHDMPTRIHWVMDLRTLLAEAGKRTCTQAQFPWRLIFAGMAKELRNVSDNITLLPGADPGEARGYEWQYQLIADRLRPVCFQTGSCGFMAKFDRSCSIRSRVDANASIGRAPSEWDKEYTGHEHGDYIAGIDCAPEEVSVHIKAIRDWEWAADPRAARS